VVDRKPEQLVFPLASPEQRRTRNPLPEALVRQFLRQLSKSHAEFLSKA
jgi:hypothetical protein